MENLTYKNKKKDCTKQEPDTLKKSEVVTNDDRKSKITAPTTLVHVTSTPAKASEQCSRLSPTRHSDKPTPPTSVGVANQQLQPEGSAKAGLVVSTRAKEFKTIPPNQAGPLERKKAFRILKRLATNPIREDPRGHSLGKGSSPRLRHRNDYQQQQQAREVDGDSSTSEQEG